MLEGGENMEAYFRTFTCAKCGRKFTKMIGGFVLTPREVELKTTPVCDSCKEEQAINMVMKGIYALMKTVKRKH